MGQVRGEENQEETGCWFYNSKSTNGRVILIECSLCRMTRF
jgi:hypothetical protein